MMLYYMDVSGLDLYKIESHVSPERIKKSNQYIHQKDKKLSIGVEILLRYALGKIGVFDPVFDIDKYDKPYLKNYPDIFFNLSHSEYYVACVVSDSPVGVDIEYIHDIDLNIAENYFYSNEYDYIINNKFKKKAFFELWVLKESYMKMTGLGFRLPLDDFCIEINDEIKLSHNGNTSKFGIWEICNGGYMLGVCSKKSVSEPILIQLTDVEKKMEMKKEI
ncbi:4'-phosphopantetheinyl transferase family protein [Methanobacterium alcaliphilum]|uniref:4'-phosphopantetheinyl transferase family protein n=1 Tax=Methanobacterium alcaliphilum TaxID=392018 RepID=UPI00200B1C74|nr:4'-phosphopantetheinyl transferase superfamily protein [Methanobacterium alcaliphilum]MCK9150624.1 4'-phosphopantetheinyl transferase superfamily protein [Methanobacterium alcaliphilum]